MRDLTILLDMTTGLVADITEAIVAAGVELSAGCVFMRTEGRVGHIAVDDDNVATVRDVVARLGAEVVDDRECVVVAPGHPGGASAIARKVADSGVPVLISYYGARGELVIGTADPDATRAAVDPSRLL